jgi:hypothetical protein
VRTERIATNADAHNSVVEAIARSTLGSLRGRGPASAADRGAGDAFTRDGITRR